VRLGDQRDSVVDGLDAVPVAGKRKRFPGHHELLIAPVGGARQAAALAASWPKAVIIVIKVIVSWASAISRGLGGLGPTGSITTQ
jgi:hypothetical protein